MQSSTAPPTSYNGDPTASAAIPAHSESSVASIRARSGADPSSRPPTINEIAASPCQPSTIAPQSIDTRSPSRTVRAPGIPWTTSSFTLTHRLPVKPWYPRNDGGAPRPRMYSSAVLSRSPVVIPSLIWPRTSSRVSPTTTPAARIFRIWSGVLTSRPLRPNTDRSFSSSGSQGRLGCAQRLCPSRPCRRSGAGGHDHRRERQEGLSRPRRPSAGAG